MAQDTATKMLGQIKTNAEDIKRIQQQQQAVLDKAKASLQDVDYVGKGDVANLRSMDDFEVET